MADHRPSPSRRDVLTARLTATPAGADVVGHICSLVVHARPERLSAVTEALREMPGVEIHGANEAGRIVVTIETETQDAVVQTMGRIGELPGVLSTALVFQHFEGERA